MAEVDFVYLLYDTVLLPQHLHIGVVTEDELVQVCKDFNAIFPMGNCVAFPVKDGFNANLFLRILKNGNRATILNIELEKALRVCEEMQNDLISIPLRSIIQDSEMADCFNWLLTLEDGMQIDAASAYTIYDKWCDGAKRTILFKDDFERLFKIIFKDIELQNNKYVINREQIEGLIQKLTYQS
jgi:hypothetical protein